MPNEFRLHPPGHRYRPDERRRILAAYHRSGFSRARFCADEGIHTTTLTRWLDDAARAAAPSVGTALVPVTIVDADPSRTSDAAARFEIRLPTGVEVAVPSRFDRAALESLLCALRSAAC